MVNKEFTTMKLDLYDALMQKTYLKLSSHEQHIVNALGGDPLVKKEKPQRELRKPRTKELIPMKKEILKLVNLINIRKATALDIEKFLNYVFQSKTNMFFYSIVAGLFNRKSDVFTIVTTIHKYGANKENRRNKSLYVKKILPYLKSKGKKSEEFSKFIKDFPSINLWRRPEIHPTTICYLENILKVGNIKQFKI
jgi:hypothetical protein